MKVWVPQDEDIGGEPPRDRGLDRGRMLCTLNPSGEVPTHMTGTQSRTPEHRKATSITVMAGADEVLLENGVVGTRMSGGLDDL